MKISEIMHKLAHHYILSQIQIKSDTIIDSIQIYTPQQGTYELHTLYIGQIQLEAPLKLLNLAANGAWNQAVVRCPCVSNTKSVLADQGLIAVFNTANGFLAQERQQTNQLDTILQWSLNHDYQTVLNVAAKQLNNTLMVIDQNYRVLAYSRTFPFPDPLWQRNIDQGYAELDFIHGIQKISHQTPTSSQSSYRFPCPNSTYQRLVAQSYFKQQAVGYIVMFNDQQDFTILQKQLLPQIGQIISDLLGKTAIFKDHQITVKGQLLADVLRGVNQKAIRVNAKIINYTLPKQMRFLAIRSFNPAQTVRQLRKLFPQALTVFYQNRLVVLLPLNLSAPKINWQQIQQKLQSQLIISEAYTDFFATPKHYQLIQRIEKLTLQLEKQQQIVFCRDYYFTLLLAQAEKSQDLTVLRDPNIQHLHQYDQQNQTALLSTLAQYIDCGGNQTKTAQKLFIHRNTLLNRLRKITALTGLNLKESQHWFQLLCGLKLQQYLKYSGG